ncbi:MAG: type II toxin-antitoxin system VapC family toxin [Anaerolineae bacterium]
MIVLDASALLAFMFQETGHELVAAHIDDCCLSAVNLSEVIGRFVRDGHDPQVVLQQIMATSIEIVPFSAHQAALTAALLPKTRESGLSLSDRACLSLGLARQLPVLTADRVWQQVEVALPVELIR